MSSWPLIPNETSIMANQTLFQHQYDEEYIKHNTHSISRKKIEGSNLYIAPNTENCTGHMVKQLWEEKPGSYIDS